MSYSADRFMEEGDPVGEFFYGLYHGFYWHYEQNRAQRQDVTESPAVDSEINEENQSVWGLDLSETNGPPAVDVEGLKDHILYAVLAQARENRESLLNFYRGSWDDREGCSEQAFRNLSNAWRDEFILNYPKEEDYEFRMQSAEWRITVCYYSLYKSLSAIVHTKDSSDLSTTHVSTANRHANEFMDMPATQPIFVYPYNFHPDDTRYFDFSLPYPAFQDYPDEFVEEHLERLLTQFSEESNNRMTSVYNKITNISTYSSDRSTDTFYHLMKLLREWANYEEGRIFARLHGDGYLKAIDRTLQLLTYSALVTSEVAVIASFGFEEFRSQVEGFHRASTRGITNCADDVLQRNQVYSHVISDF